MHDHPSPDEVAALETAYRTTPESRAFAPLADAYRELGRLDEAVAILQRGTAQHPTYVSALVLQAECELQAGQVEQAEATFARVAELEPDNLVALKYRATRAANRGAAEHAATLWQQVLDIDPFDVTARSARERLQQAPPPPSAQTVAESDAAAFDALGAVPDAPEPAVAEPTPPEAIEPEPPEITLPEMPRGAPEEALEPTIEPDFAAPQDAGEPPTESDVAEALRGFEPLDDDALETLDPSAVTPTPSDAAQPGADNVGSLPNEPPALEDAPGAEAPPTPAILPDAPAKPLADWHVQRADDRIVVRQGPDPGPGEGELGPPQRPTDEFSTLTLARIYESQGYLDKALDIYQALHTKHPEHPEVLERLRALQERMAGFAEGADAEVSDSAEDLRPSFEFAPAEAANVVPEVAEEPEPLVVDDDDDEIAAAAMAPDEIEPAPANGHDAGPTSPPVPEEVHADLGAPPPRSDDDVPYEDGVSWRLLDVESLDQEPHRRAEELREVTEGVRAREQAKRHTVIGTPRQEPRPPQAKDPSAPSEPDFERFLRYVRSIKR